MDKDRKYGDIIRSNITKYRLAVKMSKSELARRCDVSAPTVTNWENGRNSIAVENLFRIADALGVSADALGGRITAPRFSMPKHTAPRKTPSGSKRGRKKALK